MSTDERTDRDHLETSRKVLGGDEEALKDATERDLGTRDLDEADRRTRMVWEHERENMD